MLIGMLLFSVFISIFSKIRAATVFYESPRTTVPAKMVLYCFTEEKIHLHLEWPESE